MPLKHTTETFLVFLLGVVILLTGLLITTLPDLPAGALPWGVLFVCALLYPLILLLLFRRHRADHSFRLLHWFPAGMLLIWLLLQLLALSKFRLLSVVDWYTWGWTLPATVLAFILLISFCLRVIRRRTQRILLLLLAFVPFVIVAVVSQQSQHWDRDLSAFLWQRDVWKSLEGRSFFGWKVGRSLPTSQNLTASTNSSEEAWRELMRLQENQRARAEKRLARLGSGESSAIASEEAEESSIGSLSGTGQEIREVKTMPRKLPSSGPELGFIIILFAALYAGVLHDRARRRA
ncbi:MAG: hypothetical protein PHI23_04250 [Candidatus Peribacteraceae bacterium]|nr:hypothetical protein [Candidatus Peribacteraceae bacterium]